MSYHLSYDNVEKYIRLFIIKIIHKKIKNNKFTINNSNTLTKILNNNTNSKFFNSNLIYQLITYNNQAFCYFEIIKKIKIKFINSLLLIMFNSYFGIYLLKFYYIQFFIYSKYELAIKFICKKIYQKCKNSKNISIQSRFQNRFNRILMYSNISNINLTLKNIDNKYKFSYNDDNNYNIVNDIISNFTTNLNKKYIINFKTFPIYYNDKNLFLELFNNINNYNKNIILI